MTIEQLTQTAKDLKTFVNGELERIKTLDGLNLDSFKAASGIIQDVINMIDHVKFEFADITNEQMQGLAVDAVYGLVDSLLKTRMGTVGKIAYALLPNKLKRSLCAMIVDLVVHAIHNTAAKVKAAFTKEKPTVAIPVEIPASAAPVAPTPEPAAVVPAPAPVERAATVVADPK